MNADEILKNREISDELMLKLKNACAEVCEENEKILFVIVGDLTLGAEYGTEIFAVTARRSFTIDENGSVAHVTKRGDVKKAEVRRMYGNAHLVFTDQDEVETTVFRFTYSVATLAETAADYIERISAGEDAMRAYDAVAASYEKAMQVCPKCGSPLLHAGADCIHCQSKRRVWGKLLVFAKPELPNLAFCLILSLVTTGLSMLIPMLTSVLVDDVIPNGNLAMLARMVMLGLAAYVLQLAFGIIRSYRLHVSTTNAVTNLRNTLFEKTQKLNMRFYDKTTTGAVITRVNGDSSTLEQFLIRVSQEVVVQFFMLLGIVAIMFVNNWQLALVTLIPIPFVVIITRILGKRLRPVHIKVGRNWTAVVSNLTDTLPAVRMIKSFSAEKRTSAIFNRYNARHVETMKNAARITTVVPNVVSFLVNCGQLLIWSVGGAWVVFSSMHGVGGAAETTLQIAGGTVSLGTLVAFVSYASMFYAPVNFFANFNESYQNALVSAERILDILGASEERDRGKGNCPELHGRIEFNNVNFSYDRTKLTLQDISFTIEEGDIVGIVGTTGSGKSTLVNLLMRFYDNYEGKITVDGTDIRDIDLSYLRRQIGYVQQESMMFRNTVYNNIAFSRPEATPREVFAAADVANAHEFIARLPDGYDTMLGERGVGLSGGERQRVSIARTVLMNPRMLVFDEATASVDSETESLIQGAIEALIKGRTTIMIAHRLSTLRKANKIIVLDKGRILEMGSPEELLAKKGKYYKLVQI